MPATPPQTTLNGGACYACYGASLVEMLELSFLDSISQNIGGIVPPVDPYDGLLVYTRQGLGTTTVVNPSGAFNLTFGANKVTEIHCHNCPLITGITCTADALLTVLDLENCPAMANLIFTGCTALPSVDLTGFTSFSGQVEFQGCTSLASFLVPDLVTVGAQFNLIITGVVNQICPSLVSCGDYFGCSGNSLLTVSTPVLSTIGENYYCANSPNLTSASSPLLTTAPTGLYFDNCASLASINFNSLVTTDLISAGGCSALTSISLPDLNEVTSYLSLDGCTSLETVAFLAYSGNLPFTIGSSFCPSLSVFYFDTMWAADGCSFMITDSALDQTSVNSFIQSLTDAGTTSSVLDTSGGTNAAPDATHAAQVVALNIAGNSVTTN